MTYDFKKVQELAWFVAVAILVYVADAVRQQDVTLIKDWGTWLLILAGGAGRAALAALGTWLTANVLSAFRRSEA